MREPSRSSAQDRRYLRVAAQFGAAIERIARGYEADPELRRDLVQDIHAELWKSFGYFEDQCSERSWLYRIAHNVAVSHLIRRRRISAEKLMSLDEVAEFAGPTESDPESEAGARRLVERLLAMIHRLKPADRQVMLLYLDDLSADEIAEVTGLSPGAVAVRIHRAKAVLSEPFFETEARA